jgi:hypothetical protein
MSARGEMADRPFYNETSERRNSQSQLGAEDVELVGSPIEKGILLKEMASISTKCIHEQS